MPGRHEGKVEVLVRLRAAGIARIDLLNPKARHMHGKLVDRDERGGILADGDGIAGVVLMAMGERHMSHPLCHLPHRVARILEGRVSGENGSIRRLDLLVSMRKQEWPNQVMCIGLSQVDCGRTIRRRCALTIIPNPSPGDPRINPGLATLSHEERGKGADPPSNPLAPCGRGLSAAILRAKHAQVAWWKG
jgi:hypothetical protein